ncbi:MAG: quinone-dependent dihydroorotate dehydrogenase [Bacteroidetes bacterium]|nr:quinone-dependent dihydroorotate dehydrogenase [Bacteroidota bacterium]
MYRIIRFFLFILPPENAHIFVMKALKIITFIPGVKYIFKQLFCINNQSLQKEIAGVKFKNIVGLAAGFDKDAKYIDQFALLGFGFIEIGTITPRAQPGNDKPRIFRLKKDNALINRMGFNNNGADEAVKNLKKVKADITIGGNIGKNKITPNEEAFKDYLYCFEKLYDYVDYFVVNVSSPNTPGLRELQEKSSLEKIFVTLFNKRNEYIDEGKLKKPVFLKIAPDLEKSQLDDIAELVNLLKIDGLIATNTTIDRANLKSDQNLINSLGNGGLSGKPLKNKSDEILKYVISKLGNKTPIIGVGGIHSADDALDKIKSGAAAVQLYTGFIYEGPCLTKKILKKI